MKRALFFLILIVCSTVSFSQKQKKVQFVGGARSLLSHSNFTSDGDTTTAPRATGGYALMDLGIKIRPNKSTEILGMFRINNAFGGFWGGGVSFDVRQLYVRGVAADVVRYQVGNIDYKLTPYTFYNHDPDIMTSSIGTQRIKQDVINYETFYKKNTWRQQGASINFALQFPKVIKELEVNGFITRLNPSNFNNILERLYGGGNLVITQGKHLQLGVNHVSVFDLQGTALDSNQYSNHVSSLTYDLRFKKEMCDFGIDGESGIGSVGQSLFPENRLSDYFLHARAYFELKKTRLSFDIGYMDNGPDFRSFGAQSKRVNFDQENNFYRRYTNDQILRPISVYDLYNDPTLYNQGIRVGLMDYDPKINNALPYGIATFNRRGGYLGVNYRDSKEAVEAAGKFYSLSEIRGQGTNQLKTFFLANVQGAFHGHRQWNWKKDLTVQLGLSYQQSTRTGDFTFEKVDLNSVQMNIGAEAELIDKLYVMGNLFVLQSAGQDQLPVRDANDMIVNFTDYAVDGAEMNLAGGLKFAFSEKTFLAAMYEFNRNTFVVDHPYTYRQLSIFYVMKF